MGLFDDYKGSSKSSGLFDDYSRPQPQAPSPEDAERDFFSWGFLGNLAKAPIKIAGDVAEGIGNIVGAVGHDVLVNPVKEGLGFINDLLPDSPSRMANEGPSTSFYTDDVFKNITGYTGRSGMLPQFDPDKSAVATYFKDTYLSGGDAFLDALHDDPGSIALDAASLATGGGALAARAGKAGLLGKGALAQKVLPGLGKVDDLGNPMPLGGSTERIIGTGREAPVVQHINLPANPVRRAVRNKVGDLITKPVSSLKDDLDTLDPGMTVDRADIARINETLRLAGEKNITRITRPSIARSKFGDMMRRLQAEHSSVHTSRRDEWMRPYEQHWRAVPEEIKEDFDLRLQGLEPTAQSAGKLTLEEIAETLSDPGTAATPRGRFTAEVAAKHIEKAQAITDPIEARAARSFIEGQLGEPLAAIRRGIEDPVADSLDNFSVQNLGQEALQMVERWDFDNNPQGPYLTLLERSLKPLHYQRTGKWDFDSPEEALALADELAATGQKMPAYFPYFESLKLNRSDFLGNWRLFNMKFKPSTSKKAKGTLLMRRLQGTKDAYETNPAKAYGRAAAQAIKLEETSSWIDDMTRSLGRPIETLADRASGERAINLDGSRARIRRRLDEELVMTKALEEGADVDEARLAGIEHAFSTMEEGMAAEIGSQGNLWAVPKSAADKIEAVAKSRVGGSSAALRLFYEGPIDAWRKTVLYYRPGFYVYNVYGNQAMLAIQGGRSSGVLRQASARYRKALDKIIEQAPPEIRAQITQGWHGKTVQRGKNLGAAADTKVGKFAQGVKDSPVGILAGDTTDQLRRFASGVENFARRESYLTGIEKAAAERGIKLAGTSFFRSKKRLEQLMELGADPKIAREGLTAVDKALNNYMMLGAWERNVMVRLLFPFWPFYKHAARTLLTMPYEHTAKAALLDKIALIDDEMRSQTGPVPDWLETALPLGGDQFMMTRGANPFADVADRLDEGIGGVAESAVSLLNPVLKGIFEYGTGRDSFTGRPFTDATSYAPYGSDQAYDINTGEPRDVRPGLLDYLLGTIPQAGMVQDILGGGARYDSGETIIDHETGLPKYPTDWQQEVMSFLGVPVIDFNTEAYQEKLRQDQAALARERAKRGL